MVRPRISHEQLLKTLSYCPETGIFTALVTLQYNAVKGSVIGSFKQGYWCIRIKQKNYDAHRLAWFYMTGNWPTLLIDHINGDVADNRWANLREASHAQNAQNTFRASKNNKSGFLGVNTRPDGKFVAAIGINRKVISLGTYTTPEAAHEAYLKAKKVLHPFSELVK